MLEITPIPPYPETVRYPFLANSGNIGLANVRPSIFSVFTAGLVLDDQALDRPIPPNPAGEPAESVRNLGFTITQVGERFFMPEAVSFYELLASQMLGALTYDASDDSQFVEYYSFYLEETAIAEAYAKGDVHYDASTSAREDRAALVSNVLPTWYCMQRLNRFKSMVDYTLGFEWTDIPPEFIWCPQPREITVQEGGTPHGTPDFPTGVSLTRRLASLRLSTGLLDPAEVARIEIDDSFYREEDVQRLMA